MTHDSLAGMLLAAIISVYGIAVIWLDGYDAGRKRSKDRNESIDA